MQHDNSLDLATGIGAYIVRLDTAGAESEPQNKTLRKIKPRPA